MTIRWEILWTALLPAALALVSCQTAPRVPEIPGDDPEIAAAYFSIGEYAGGDLISPGLYEQKIEIEPSRGGSFQFLGFLRRRLGEVEVSGLSPFGTTIFRIRDGEKRREPKIEIFVPELESRRSRLEEFYSGLRPLLFLKDSPKFGSALVPKRHPDGRPRLIARKGGAGMASDSRIWIDAYAAEAGGVPDKIRVVTPGWTARISLRRYEAGN